jgi:hypothetical protein
MFLEILDEIDLPFAFNKSENTVTMQ